MGPSSWRPQTNQKIRTRLSQKRDSGERVIRMEKIMSRKKRRNLLSSRGGNQNLKYENDSYLYFHRSTVELMIILLLCIKTEKKSAKHSWHSLTLTHPNL